MILIQIDWNKDHAFLKKAYSTLPDDSQRLVPIKSFGRVDDRFEEVGI